MSQNESSLDDETFMLQALLNVVLPKTLYVAASLGIADSLADRPKTADELASEAHADPGSLYRILRLLAAHGILKEAEGKRFELNGRGHLLRRESLVPLAQVSSICVIPQFGPLWASFQKRS